MPTLTWNSSVLLRSIVSVMPEGISVKPKLTMSPALDGKASVLLLQTVLDDEVVSELQLARVPQLYGPVGLAPATKKSH